VVLRCPVGLLAMSRVFQALEHGSIP
jgi:hypothetical protein